MAVVLYRNKIPLPPIFSDQLLNNIQSGVVTFLLLLPHPQCIQNVSVLGDLVNKCRVQYGVMAKFFTLTAPSITRNFCIENIRSSTHPRCSGGDYDQAMRRDATGRWERENVTSSLAPNTQVRCKFVGLG